MLERIFLFLGLTKGYQRAPEKCGIIFREKEKFVSRSGRFMKIVRQKGEFRRKDEVTGSNPVSSSKNLLGKSCRANFLSKPKRCEVWHIIKIMKE